MTNTDNRRELEKALEQLELAIDLKSDEAADAYAAGKKVEEALQNPISERWGKQICLN